MALDIKLDEKNIDEALNHLFFLDPKGKWFK